MAVTVTHASRFTKGGRKWVMVSGVLEQGVLPRKGTPVQLWLGDSLIAEASIASGAALDVKLPHVLFALTDVDAELVTAGARIRTPGSAEEKVAGE
jgi:hypothetical protein